MKCSLPPLLRFSTLLAIVIGLCGSPQRAAGEPILVIDQDSFATDPPVSVVQGASAVAIERGVLLDGSPLDDDALGLSLQGNPFASARADRWLGPIDLATGRFSPLSIDLALPARVPWVVGRGYKWRPAGATSDGSPQGRNWFQLSTPELVKVAGTTDRLYLIYSADRFVEFAATVQGSFRAVNGAAGVVKYTAAQAGAPDFYQVLDASSSQMYFFGAEAGAAAGQVWKIEDSVGGVGHAAYVGRSPSALTNPAVALSEGYSQGRLLYAVDAADRLYSYSYTSIAGVPRLTAVKAEVKAGGAWGGSPTGVRQVGLVSYDYYQSSVPDAAHGRVGDLRMVSILKPLTDSGLTHDTRVYYRYRADGNLKLRLSEEGARRFEWDQNGSIGWLSNPAATPSFIANDSSAAPSDDLLKPYASIFFSSYDASGRITSVWFDGMAGGSSPAGDFIIRYEASSAPNAAGYQPEWRLRTIIKMPERAPSGPAGSTWLTQYFDEAGLPLSQVVTDGDPASGTGVWAATSQCWVSRVERNTSGQVIRAFSPENTTQYAHNAVDAASMFTSAPSSGLVTVFDRVPGTGGDAGFLQAIRHAKGSSGLAAALYVWYGTYTTQSQSLVSGGPAVQAIRLATSRSYPVETTNAEQVGAFDQWTYSRTWWPGTLIAKQVTTTQPAVPTAKNGSGASWSTASYYNPDGSLAFTKSQAGRLVYFGYDSITGLRSHSIFDADPDRGDITTEKFNLAAVDLGSSDPGSSGLLPALHIRTSFGYDDQGRLTSHAVGRQRLDASSPGQSVLRERRAEFAYTRLADNRLVSINVPYVNAGAAGAPTSYGLPAVVAVSNLAGRTEALGRIYRAPSAGRNAPPIRSTTRSPLTWINPSAANPINSLVPGAEENPLDFIAMSTARFSPTGARIIESRRYFSVPAVGSGDGSSTANYDFTTFDYDNSGRVFRTTDPTHTINRYSFDERGSVSRVWRGTDDSAQSNLRPLADFTYDRNGALAATRSYPTGLPGSAQHPDRLTDFIRDYRGRITGVVNPAEPHAIVERDNLGRITAGGLFGGSRNELLGALPFPSPNDDAGLSTKGLKDNRLSLGLTEFDPLGQVWRQTQQPIEPPGSAQGGERSSPGAGGCNAPVQTNNWYGAHGKLKMSAGESITKYEYCRDCEVKRIAVIAGVSPAIQFGQAMSVQADDVLVKEIVFERSFAPGDEWLRLEIDRYPGLDGQIPSSGPAPPLGMAWYPDGSAGVTGIPNSTSGRFDLRIAKPDEFGIPTRWTLYGDLDRDSSGGPACAGANCDNTNIPTRVYESQPEPRDIVCGVVDPLGRGFMQPPPSVAQPGFTQDGHPIRLQEFKPPQPGQVIDSVRDDAGQLLAMEYRPPATEPVGPCEVYRWYYEKSRPAGMQPPGTQAGSGQTYPVEYRYADNTPSLPPEVAQHIKDNTTPVGTRMPDGKQSWQQRLADGSIVTELRPGGDKIQRDYDQFGRPVLTTTTPGVSSVDQPRLTSTTYDQFGRPTQITQRDSPGGPVLNEVKLSRDTYGFPAEVRQSGMGPVPPGPGPSDMGFQGSSCAPAVDSSGRRGWSGPRLDQATLPGGYPLNLHYDPNIASQRVGEPRIDAALQRVNRLTGAGGEVLANYGYYGVYNPAWTDMPGPNLENPTYLPSNPSSPVSTPELGKPLLNSFGEVQRDIWQRPATGDQDLVKPVPPTGNFPGWVHHDTIERDPIGRGKVLLDDAMTWRNDPAIIGGGGGSALPGFDTAFGRNECTGEIIFCGRGINPSPTGESSGGGTVGGFFSLDNIHLTQRAQRWGTDPRGNWSTFKDHVLVSTANADSTGVLETGDSDWSNTHNDADKPTSRTQTTLSGAAVAHPTHDDNGNCTDNGRFIFKYTALGQLAEVYRRSSVNTDPPGGAPPSGQGLLFARFTYNGLGWRTSAVYDSGDDANPNHPGAGDGDLNTDTREFYVYDPLWRLVAVFRQGPVGTGGAAAGERPAPRLYERYVYHAQGPRGMGDVRGLDRLLCRHRDADNNPATSLAGMSDGLEEAVYYVQNHRGDVVALVDAFGNPLERIRYTAYGEPQAYHPVDFQNRGEVTPDTLSDYIAYFFAPDTDAKPPGVDFDCSGALDPDDLSSFIGAFFGPPDAPPLSDPTGPVPPGVGSLSRASVDNRFGYAAYVWDNHLGLYHVRNRVYDPYHGRWLQPDPIGFAGGMNLYQYCGGDPVDAVDPMGLGPDHEWQWHHMTPGDDETRRLLEDAGIDRNFKALGRVMPTTNHWGYTDQHRAWSGDAKEVVKEMYTRGKLTRDALAEALDALSKTKAHAKWFEGSLPATADYGKWKPSMMKDACEKVGKEAAEQLARKGLKEGAEAAAEAGAKSAVKGILGRIPGIGIAISLAWNLLEGQTAKAAAENALVEAVLPIDNTQLNEAIENGHAIVENNAKNARDNLDVKRRQGARAYGPDGDRDGDPTAPIGRRP